MRKWKFTFVAYNEANNYSVEVSEDELDGKITGNQIFLVGGAKIPRGPASMSWKTWRIEELSGDRRMLGMDEK